MSLTTGLSSGCGHGKSIPERDPFLTLYDTKAPEVREMLPEGRAIKPLDLTAHDMPLSHFVQWFSDQTGMGVVYSAEADKATFSGEFRHASPEDAITTVARRCGFELVKVGRTYYIGKLESGDRGSLVRRVKGYSVSEIKDTVTTFLGEFGKVAVTPDGVLVVSDREAVLSRVSAMLDSLESSAGDTWIVQFFILNIKKDVSVEAGGQVTTSGQLAYNISKRQDGSGTTADTDWQNLGQSIQAVMNASSSYVDMRAAPMLLVRDGREATWSDGETVPIPQKTVSTYGTVTTTGYSFVDTGLMLKCTVREANGGANLNIDLTDSNINGYVEDYPRVAKVSSTTTSFVRSGCIYLVAELHRRNSGDDMQNVLDFTSSSGGRKMQVWCRVYRVSVPVATLVPEWKEPKDSKEDKEK